MQKPLPGPNVMLPAIRLSDPPDLDSHLAYKRREAIWKKLISTEHKKWCLCGSYINHFLPSTEPLQNSSCTSEDTGDTSGGEKGAAGGEESEDLFTEEDFIEGIEEP